ncbi:unnamed protein product, partial [Urochloa humidicola]
GRLDPAAAGLDPVARAHDEAACCGGDGPGDPRGRACGRAWWRVPHPRSPQRRLHLPEIHCLRLHLHLHLRPCLYRLLPDGSTGAAQDGAPWLSSDWEAVLEDEAQDGRSACTRTPELCTSPLVTM